MTNHKKRIVIIGGSYAGSRVAYEAARLLKRDEAEIMLITEEDYHADVPELYEIATAYLDKESTLSTENIYPGSGVPVSELLAKYPVKVVVGSVDHIVTQERTVFLTDHRAISFDWLVLAVGAPVASYGIPGVLEYCFTIKNMHEALRLRHHIMRCVLKVPDLYGEEQKAAQRFIIIGAGATGVELAAELSGLLSHLQFSRHLMKDVPEIILLEAGPTILKELPEGLRQAVKSRLEKLGVKIMTNQAVSAIQDQHVFFKDGSEMHAHTIAWSGGLKAHDLLVRSHLPVEGRGVKVNEKLQIQDHPTIFAVGDCAVLFEGKQPVPAIVPVAYTQGAVAGHNVVHAVRGEELEVYHYKPKGQLITLGGKQVLFAMPGNRSLMGRIPWIIRQLVNIRYWMRYLSLWGALRLTMRRLSVQTKND